MTAGEMTTTPCCTKPSIVKLDYKDWDCDSITINRVCIHCSEHWFGIDGDVKHYTRQEWDAYLTEGWKE